MKKRFTLILASMLLTMGAWAEVLLPTVSDGTAMHYYRIKSLRTGKYAAYTGDNTQLAQMADPTIECIWYVTADGENYKLHNLATENVYAGVSSFTSTGVTVYIQENPYRAGYVCISTTEDLSSNCWDDQGSGTKIGNYNPRQNDNEGTSWTFEKVDAPVAETYTFVLTEEVSDQEFTGEYICYTYEGQKSIPTCVTEMGGELVEPVWNEENKSLTATITFPIPVSQKVMINPFSGYAHWYYVSDTDVKVTKTAPTDETVNNYLWVIEPALTEGKFTFAIKNVATEKYMSSASNTDQHAQGVVTLSETGTQFTLEGSNQFKIQDKYLSTNSSATADQFAGTWSEHSGTKNNVYVADHISYTLTDNAGNTFEGSCEGYARVDEPTLTGAHGYTLSNASWTNGNHFAATITFPYPVSKVDGATNATLLSSYFNAKQWHAVDGNVLVQTAGANLAELDYWMWAIYPACNDGAFTFTIKNIATGLYVTANSTGSKLDTSGNNYTGADGVVTLTGSGTAFSIPSERDFAFTINDATAYLSINSDQDTNVNLGVHTVAHNGTNVLTPSFAQLEKYQVTIGSTGYSTLYTPIKVAVPDGITAYIGTLNDANDLLTLTEVENVIPANTAVVLQGTANTYTFSASSDAAAEIANNALVGSTETVATTSVEGTVYTLQSHDFDGDGVKEGIAFKQYAGTNLTGFKAYLAVESQTNAFRIRKGSEEGTTSIENAQLTMDNENVVIYDLQGRRVEKMEKGIYIVNGKKIIK